MMPIIFPSGWAPSILWTLTGERLLKSLSDVIFRHAGTADRGSSSIEDWPLGAFILLLNGRRDGGAE